MTDQKPSNNHGDEYVDVNGPSHRRLARRLRREHYRHSSMEPVSALPAETMHKAGAVHHHEAETQVERLRDQLMRLQAEFENFRKRVRREEQQKVDLANVRLVEQLLPVLDNFERALAQPGESVEAYKSGVEMIYKQMMDLLGQQGLEKVPCLAQPFDPNLHEAVAAEAATDTPDNQITDVYQNCYKFKGRLLRPAMVKVARNP